MKNRRIQFAAVAVSAAVAFAPASASAQLGRLKKAATEAAKEVTGAKPEPAKAAAGSSSSLFVITPERLTAVIAVMETNMARAEKEAAAKAAEADYNSKKKAWESCAETQLKAVTGKMPATDGIQKSAAISKQSSAISQKLAPAQSSQNYRAVIALTDTMQILSMRSALVMYGADAKCGAGVYMPPALVDAAAEKMARSNSSDSRGNETVVSPEHRAGMTTQQFGMVRERMALWVLQQTNNAPVGNNKYGVFTAEEQAALDAQGAKIKKWAPVFKDAPNTWATWGDIKSW